MIILLLSAAVCVFLFHELFWKRRHLPPGPTPLPFMGNILAVILEKPGYECFRRWTKQFGDVYTFWMGKLSFERDFIRNFHHSRKCLENISHFWTIKINFFQNILSYGFKFFYSLNTLYSGN